MPKMLASNVKAHVPGAAADSAGDHKEAKKDLRSRGDKEGLGAQGDHFWIAAEKADDLAGKEGHRDTGGDNDGRADGADIEREFARQILPVCP